MESTWLALFLCLINMCIDVLSLCISTNWMLDSGIFYLSQFQLNIIRFSLVLYFLIAILFEIIYITGKSFYVYIDIFVLLVLVFVQSYSGITWIVDPKSIFTSMYTKWMMNINTPVTNLIQFQLRCCGFRAVNEFKSDLCKESSYQACLPLMIKHYSMPVQIVGIFELSHLILDVLLLILLWRSLRRKKKHRRNKSSRSNYR